MSTAPSDRAVKLLKLTDGRDKLYKATAGLAKVVAYNAVDQATSKKMSALAKSIGDARSLMRMGKWIQKNNEAGKEIATIKEGDSKTDTQRGYMKVFRILADMGYIVGDNLQWLGKYELITLDHKAMAKRSKVFQFWGYVMSCYLQLYDLLLHAGRSGSFTTPTAKKLILAFIRDFCDLLCALAAIDYIKSFKPSSGTLGALSLCSATIATQANWKATA